MSAAVLKRQRIEGDDNMSWNWHEELKEIVGSAVERKLNHLALERQWENSASIHGLVYTESVTRSEILLCRKKLEEFKKSGMSFEQAKEKLVAEFSEKLLKVLLEMKRMETERLLPYTIVSISDLTDDLSTAHYVYLSKETSNTEPLTSSTRDELRKLAVKFPELFSMGQDVVFPREYDMTFIVGFINHFYGRAS